MRTHGRFRNAFALGAATATLGLATRAAAQPVIERFDPSERGSRFFVADSLQLDGDLRFTTGVVMSYGSRLRTFRQSDAPPGEGRESSRLIENSFWIHPGASIVLAPGARFGLDVPVALQTGIGATIDGTYFPEPSSPAFGDVRGSFDLRLLGGEGGEGGGGARSPVLAAGVSAYLPTGASSAYASDDFARVALRLAGAWEVGPMLLAARVGYMYRKDDLVFAGVRLGGEGNGSLAVGYHYGGLVIGPELYGSTVLKTAFDRRSTPLEVLGGAHAQVGAFTFGAGIGTAIVTGLGAPGFRGVLSIEWAPAHDVAPELATHAGDRDNDSVPDADDVCPDVPGPADAPLASRGCPPPPIDSDGDGIIDDDDACPQAPGPSSRDRKTHGCPEAPTPPAPPVPDEPPPSPPP
jgi:hypothetical protein